MSLQEHSYKTDLVIFGGGIAGLWLLNRVRDAGYQAILIEKDKPKIVDSNKYLKTEIFFGSNSFFVNFFQKL